MQRPVVSEQDLLALIEGRLPRERVAAVRAALEAHPALLRRVQAMVRDRQALAALDAGVRAPAGLVQAAIRQANEERLTGRAPVLSEAGEWTEASDEPWWSRHRGLLIVGAAVLLLTTTIGIVAIAIIPDGRLPQEASGMLQTQRPADMSQEEWDAFLARQQAKGADAERRRAEPERLPREVPDLTEFLDDEESRRLATTPRLGSGEPAEGALMGPPAPEPWELAAAPEAPSSPAINDAVPDLADATTGASSAFESMLDRAVALAREGRLRVIAPVRSEALAMGSAPWRLAELGAESPRQPSQDLASPAEHERRRHEHFDQPRPRPDRTYHAHLATGENDDASLRESLRALFDRVAPADLDGERDLRLERLDTPLRSTTDRTPSLDASDILWWTRQPGEWDRAFGVTVEVRLTDAGAGRAD